jgi:predicted metal-binding membrane protein
MLSRPMIANETSLARGKGLRPLWTVVALLAIALATWLVVIERMTGMDSGPGTDPGALGWFLGVWVTMMAAMMLPSAASTVALFARTAEARGGRGRSVAGTAAFVAGYLAAWATVGLLAYALYRFVDRLDGGALAWDGAGPYVAGAAIVGAGVYQLTPLKEVCLRHCRGPLFFLLRHWRPGWRGATRLGIAYGAYCVGCCWGLMLVLFAVGAMSLFWMVVIASVVFAEKVLPGGDRLAVAVAVALVVLGLWLAVSPSTVPRLTDPGAARMPAALP